MALVRCARAGQSGRLLCDAMLGGKEYGSDLAARDCYFYPFAVAARAGR